MGKEDRKVETQLKFSDDTRQIVARAHELAVSLNHEYVSPSHILLASLEDPLILGFMRSRRQDSPEDMENSMLRLIKNTEGGELSPERILDFTPRAKRVIDFAVDEAREQGKTQTEPSDILLGLIRGREGEAADMLAVNGMRNRDISLIRDQLKKFSKDFKKKVLLNMEEALSLSKEVTIHRLREIMRDPDLPLERRFSLLTAILNLMLVTKFPQQKTQKNS
ncbi:MAG: Clp protease N-terminal domain-containing protein [Candidatus Levybacteria bacterium]|nr:Clp protease N-terminal domain-containing protein [Candidatus Levybacteria bacterium]